MLPPVAGGGRPAMRSSCSSAVGLPRPRSAMGLRRRRLSSGWLPRGHSLGGHRLHLHVDLRRQVPRRQETTQVR